MNVCFYSVLAQHFTFSLSSHKFAYANLIITEEGGIRPVLVLQNNIGNAFSPTTIIAVAITSQTQKQHLPTHVPLTSVPYLKKSSLLLLEHIRTIDCLRLRKYIGFLNDNQMRIVNTALCISLGLMQ